MNKLSKQKRDQLILVTIGTLVVCGALWYLLVMSLNESLTEVKKQNKELADKIGNAEIELKKAPQIEHDYIAGSNLLSTIEVPMPSGDMYSWVITTINNFKEPYKDISIPSFSQAQMGDVEMFPSFPYKAATFHIKGSGHYDDYGRFVADFENHYPFFMVENIELTPTRQPISDDPEKLDFSMDVVALVKPTGP